MAGARSIEATQELQASDVLEVIEAVAAKPRSSIAPVDLDIDFPSPVDEEEWKLTREIRLPPMRQPRRQLKSVVLAAIGACGVILVAAAGTLLVRCDESPATSNATTTATTTATSTPASPPPTSTATPELLFTPASPPAIDPNDLPTTGTLVLDAPARPGRVWIDGKKLTASSALLACGKHQVKMGPWSRPRTVEVPCGAEVHVAR